MGETMTQLESEVRELVRRRAIDPARALDWIHGPTFDLVEVDRDLVELAARVAHPARLMPADSLVLAGAIAAGCSELYTWDDRLLAVGTFEGVRVTRPETFEPVHGRPLYDELEIPAAA